MNPSRNFYKILLLFLFLKIEASSGQTVERVYKSFIGSPQLYTQGNQQGLPVYMMNSDNKLQLEFDDLDGNVKNYFYTLVLCDYNWQPVNLSAFDYLKGFTQIRISNYRYSSIALNRYTHYQALLPEKDCMPVRSGNYLLKVYLDGDTSKLAFTRQMLVVDSKAIINAETVQPLSADKFRTHQKVRFTLTLKNLNAFSAPQQVKVVIMQNNRWDNAQRDIPPTFVRGSMLEYNSENFGIFPAGKEWRWADLRSFRLQSDRVARAVYGKTSTEVFMKPDRDRSGDRYLFFSDINGSFWITSPEVINPAWQADYATVNFYFQTPDGKPFVNRNLYLAGQFTGFAAIDRWKMKYDEETGLYTTSAMLKNGFYNYTFVAPSLTDPADRLDLEGNYWETENTYTILVYYKGFNDRNDQLIGVSLLDTRSGRPVFRF